MQITEDNLTPHLRAYIDRCGDSGMSFDQTRNFIHGDVMLQSRQMLCSQAARECDKPDGPFEVGIGGARGGGKSFWALAQGGIDDCQRVAGLKVLLLRKVGKAGKEALRDLRQMVLMGTSHNYLSGPGIIKFANGSRIITGHFRTENDIDAYLGIEYDLIIIEEATLLTKAKYNDIVTCCRSSKPNWRPRIYLTTNPGGVGHMWFYKKFIVPWKRGEETETRFIQMLSKDNLMLNELYVKQTLEKLTGWKRRAWLHGDWDILAGQYFSTFRDEVHVSKYVKSHDDGILRNYSFWLGFDYGFVHNTAIPLIGKCGEGNYYVFDEHVRNKLQPLEHQPLVTQMLMRNGLDWPNIESIEAGGDVFTRDDKGGTTAKEYSKVGMKLTRANMDRKLGAQAILQLLGNPENPEQAPPRLFIHPRCVRTVESILECVHDPKNPEDVKKFDADEDGEGGDDPYDSLRYGIMSKFSARSIGISHANI